MAAEKTSVPEFIVSRDELNSLDKALKDEKFRTLLTEFVDEISDPEKKRLHEEEVKELEKEKGVEVEFILPRAGFALELRDTAGKDEKAKRTAVNLCSSDKVAPPSCEPVINEKSRGLNWVIPHTISPVRTEVANCENNPAKDAVVIYDVVFHPDTVHLAVRNIRLRKLLIDTALDAVNKSHSLNIKFEDISKVREGEYFGKEFTCTVKRIVDAEKYRKWKQGELSLDTNGSEGTGLSQVSQVIQNKESESDTNVQEIGELSAPTHRIKYQTNMDIQNFCVPPMGVGISTRPTALVVEVDLPGVQRATEVDVDICPQFLNLRTPKHKLDLKLPYPVDEDLSSAKFDVATCMLTLNLTVIPNNSSHKPVVHSQLSDSGIECESGYRTSSDGDNSSDVSCSSLEERLVEEELNDEAALHLVASGTSATNPGEEKKSGEKLVSKVHSYLQPPFTIAQGENTLNINVKCHNVVPGSVTVSVVDEKSLQISYTNIGSGRTPLSYGLHVIMPERCSSKVRHRLGEDAGVLVVEVEKVTAEEWNSCIVEGKTVTIAPSPRIGTASEEITPAMFSNQVHEVAEEEAKGDEEKEAILQQLTAEGNVKARGDDKDLQKPSCPKEISQVTPSVAAVRAAFVKARTVSECVDVSYSDCSSDNRRGPTGSWPRGILKRRPRSLSESHVGCMGSVGSSFGSYSSSFDFEGLEDEVLEKGEEEEEEGNESSSPGSKKTVRFSEVVSKQLFRSNASILGQRAKNQRKALKKRRAQERKASESDQENTGSKKSDEEEEDEGVGTEEDLFVTLQEMKEIDLEGDIFDSTTCEEETTDTDNNNSQSDNNSKNNNNKDSSANKKRNKKKGKKNKNKMKSLELSNAMIFELDIEP